MENERCWLRGSTLAFMAVLLVPFLPANVELLFLALRNSQPIVLPAIIKCMLGVLLVLQLVFAYYVALMCDWIMDAGGTRHWLRFRLSTCLILMVAMSILVGTNVNSGLYERGYWSFSTTIIHAISGASIPVLIAFGWMMLVATSRAVDKHVPAPWGGKPRTVSPPSDATLAPLYPNRRTQILGSIPLYLLIAFMFASMLLVMEEIKPLWTSLRLELPLPSLQVLWLSDLFVKFLSIPFMLIVAANWLYWGWICKDRRRIFWFNVVVVGLLLFGLVAVALSVIIPFFKISSCILKGTPVDTPSGPKPIQDLQVGDKVLSRSPEGETGASTVTDIRSADVDEHLVLILSDGVELSCTGEHPVAAGNQWIRAKLLRIGDEVTCHDQIRKLVEIKIIKEQSTVYDITVEPHHNFFAAGVLVHNALKKK